MVDCVSLAISGRAQFGQNAPTDNALGVRHLTRGTDA
jgi:hypothetical protein